MTLQLHWTLLTTATYLLPLLYLTSYYSRNSLHSSRFHEHGILIYLDKELYKAFIKLQADKGLGRSFAGLLPFTEGLYHLGYLSKEAYEEHVKKYSQGLTEEQPSYADLKKTAPVERASKPAVDYSKLSLEELRSRYEKAKTRGDPEALKLAIHIKKRELSP